MEEKELNEITEPVAEEESDFADEVQPEIIPEAPVEEEKKEEIPAELGVNLYNDDIEVDPNFVNGQNVTTKKKGPVPTYEYTNDEFKSIEDARLKFSKGYKKRNIIKFVITAIVLVGVILGWVLPRTLGSEEWKAGNWPMYITLIVFVVMIILLAVYSFLSKRSGNKEVADYLRTYYANSMSYVFEGLEVHNISGSIDDKISKEELTDSALYKDVEKVGSRGCLRFTYQNVPCTLVECSASKRNGKNYATIFVGKMLKAPNSWEQDPVIVYVKGNKRALPPTNLDSFEVVEDKKDRVVYGKSKKRLLTQKTREAIAQIRTDKVLVDCAIMIQPGTTYVMMGYEDSLMVPAFETPFNPAPTEKFKEDLAVVLNVVESLF